jgi:hypothetical protein
MIRSALVAVLAVLMLSSCAYYNKVEPGKRTAGSGYAVSTDTSWSARSIGALEFWTVDGPALQAIVFYPPVADGEPVFGVQTKKETLPAFRKSMTPSEIMELCANTMMALAETQPFAAPVVGNRVRTTGLEPFAFGGGEGFRFDAEFLSLSGLEYRALFAGAVRREKLYLVIYTGTREHYFPKHRRSAERVLASIRLP